MQQLLPNAVLRSLSAATAEAPLARKLLVTRTMGEGRELLRSLAVQRSWVGWEVTTPRRLALELVADRLAAEGRAVADGYEEQAAVDVALDAQLEGSTHAPLRELGESPGFRQAVVNAVEALRLAGIEVSRLRSSRSSNPGVRALLAGVLEAYESRLERERLEDGAGAMALALEVFGVGEHGLVPSRMYLAPGLSLRGTTGQLVRAFLDAGARPLRTDPVEGVPVPRVLWEPASESAPLTGLLAGRAADGDLELFSASGPADELREVLRRVMAMGLPWDEVEIVATDPVVYGNALHVLSERLDIPVSFAVGLPVERTRTGRAATAYLRWIREGYPAHIIRRLLEGGDLRPADAVDPARLARRFRALRIGWGRDRYLPAIDRALGRRHRVDPRRYESEHEAAVRIDRERRELEALRSVLAPILAASPDARLTSDVRVSPAELAAGLQAFLEQVAPGDGPSATARDRLLDITGRVAATLTRPTDPAAAMALLRRHLEIRVPAPAREGSAPWLSAGGHLHLSDVEHGGYAARPATFVVGLDADRFPGAGLQDPLLLDSQRRALDPEALPTAGDRLAGARFRMAACLARLRGRVTLSYSAWDPTEARAVAPSSIMLQGYRSGAGRTDASFEELAEALGDAASAIPRTAAIDAADVWFHALEEGGILQHGMGAVRESHPALDAGLRARAALEGELPTAHHGLVTPRPGLDPRGSDAITLSASGLEDLGHCARRYLYKYVLGIRPPDDPELDPDIWLDAMDRGRLLHTVYEAAFREAREKGLQPTGAAFEGLALDVLEREARRIARDVPPPGRVVQARQMVALREDVRSFAEMVARRGAAWEALELRFGFQGEPPADLELNGGLVKLRGAIDRVDRVDGTVTVIDYKTGSSTRYESRHGTFHGGRRLQNVVYANVAESLLGYRVDRMEYHFPTRKGQNEAIGYDRAALRRGLGLIDRLLEGVAAGRFLPTEEPKDCTFCDYATICRHSVEGYRVDAPLADWAAARFADLAELRERREARAWDETFLAELEDHGPED
jgi:RecB family exonuclease